MEKIHRDIEQFAEAEHLTAHANSVRVRFDGKDAQGEDRQEER